MDKPEHQRLVAEFQGRGGAPPRVNEAWERPKVAHGLVQEQNFLRVSRELAHFKMHNGEEVSQYWARAMDLKSRCLEVEVPINNRSFMTAVLTGLPKSWGPLVMVENRMLSSQTEGGLLSSLLVEEDRRKNQKGGGSGDGSALYGGRSNSPRRGSSPHRGKPPQGKGGQGGSGGGPWQGKGEPRPKILGMDGDWGELGLAPKGYCEGCHKTNHRWRDCFRKPHPQAIPKHLEGIVKPKGEGKGAGDQGKTQWPKGGQGSGGAGGSSSVLVASLDIPSASALQAEAGQEQSGVWLMD